MNRRLITEDAYLDHLGRGVDDGLETIETLGKKAVSETTSECPRGFKTLNKTEAMPMREEKCMQES